MWAEPYAFLDFGDSGVRLAEADYRHTELTRGRRVIGYERNRSLQFNARLVQSVLQPPKQAKRVAHRRASPAASRGRPDRPELARSAHREGMEYRFGFDGKPCRLNSNPSDAWTLRWRKTYSNSRSLSGEEGDRMTPSLASNDFHGSKHPNGQSKTAEATVVKQQFDSVWAEGRSRSARGTESLQTLCWRGLDSNF